jgi:hypothetical protein
MTKPAFTDLLHDQSRNVTTSVCLVDINHIGRPESLLVDKDDRTFMENEVTEKACKSSCLKAASLQDNCLHRTGM